MAAELERFREEADRFHWSPFVGRFDDATRASIEAIALAGTRTTVCPTRRRLASWMRAAVGPPPSRSRARIRARVLFVARGPPAGDTLTDADTNVFVALALDAMVTLGDHDGPRRVGPTVDLDAPQDTPARSPAEGARGEGPWRARRSLGRGVVAGAGARAPRGPPPALGVPGKTALLVIDPAERAYWIDDAGVRPAPLEVDATSPSLALVQDAPALSSRELTAAEGRGYWLCQRYGRDVLPSEASAT